MTTNQSITQHTTRTYNFNDVQIELITDENTFAPTEWARLLINYANFKKNERILDLGSGSGVIGIYAAKKGAIVSGTEICLDAINTAKQNTKLNSVNINFYHGTFFADCKDNFDMIIANLPQEIVFKDDCLNENYFNSVNGGENGTETLFELFDTIKEKKLYNTRILTPISSLSSYIKSINYITENFELKILGVHKVKTKDYVNKFENKYEQLNNDGTIRIFKEDGAWKHLLYIVELKLKPPEKQELKENKKRLLVGHLGTMHDDFNEISKCYDKDNFDYCVFDVAEELDNFKFTKGDLIDLRNCRNYHEMSQFEQILHKIQNLPEKVNTIPSMEMINWNINKSIYLQELEKCGIKIVPSYFSNKENLSSDIVLEKINQNINRGIVLKPLIGSRAFQTVRIRTIDKITYEIFIPKRELGNSKTKVDKVVGDSKKLLEFINDYIKLVNNNFVLQNYIPSEEFNVVYFNNKLSHVVKKSGQTTDSEDNFNIHHKNFGGKNTLINKPPKKIIEFADVIFKNLPQRIINDPFVFYERIDIIQDKKTNELFLLEIEAFVPDLFMTESGKVDEYINCQKKYLLKHFQ